MIKREKIEKKVKEIIIKKLNLKGEEKKIKNDTDIKDDYGLEFEDMVVLIVAIDSKFGVLICDDDKIDTFKDIIDCLIMKIKKKEEKEKLKKNKK